MSIVTAVGSFGFFLSPLFTNYSLSYNGWVDTLYYFSLFLMVGLIISFFVRSPSNFENSEKTYSQTTTQALAEAFKNKGYVVSFHLCILF